MMAIDSPAETAPLPPLTQRATQNAMRPPRAPPRAVRAPWRGIFLPRARRHGRRPGTDGAGCYGPETSVQSVD